MVTVSFFVTDETTSMLCVGASAVDAAGTLPAFAACRNAGVACGGCAAARTGEIRTAVAARETRSRAFMKGTSSDVAYDGRLESVARSWLLRHDVQIHRMPAVRLVERLQTGTVDGEAEPCRI